ncbi:MAG: DNA-3-methyladenine glycosylase I [Alphaproteobacteria bacterium]
MPKSPSVSRCSWPGEDPLYIAYHDEEWGVPERDSRALYEKLMLDGFQAGLSWITILRKREAFRKAFKGFKPELVARFTPRDIDRLLADPSIVRHRGKIEGAIAGARATLELEADGGLSKFLWDFVDGAPIQNAFKGKSDIPTETPLSREVSKALRARSFKFVGPTIVYAFMQAVGMVNDHTVTCFRHAQLAATQKRKPR